MISRDHPKGAVAEVFPPGEFIRDELVARSWTQKEFAAILGRPLQTVNQIINGKKAITPDTAVALAEAFGTSAELWLNLENAYRLAGANGADPDVRRRARLHSLVPLGELIERRWIKASNNLDDSEAEVCAFLEINCISGDPELPMAARRAGGYGELSPGQIAWGFRAKHQASAKRIPKFDKERFEQALQTLPKLSVDRKGMLQVVPTLQQIGIRVEFVAHLSGTRIDGGMFWLDADSPVVALSFRYDRIDSFWFTLMHELAHVHKGHAKVGFLDSDLVGENAQQPQDKPKYEQLADRLAGRWLIPRTMLTRFVRQVGPFFSAARIKAFAAEVGVHPGIVVGQLQYQGAIPWSHHRKMLVKASDLLVSK